MSDATLHGPQAIPRPASSLDLPAMLRRWLRNAITRTALDDLPDHILKDIGTDWREARIEARRPFWID